MEIIDERETQKKIKKIKRETEKNKGDKAIVKG